MNLRDLEYLVALKQFRHFRKAAEHCFVSQPTLSGQLKKLETELGVQLVERTKHSVMITPIGQEIVRRAELILEEVANIENLAQAAKDPLRGPLKLGVIPTIAPYLLPHIIPKLNQAFPQIELFLKEVQTDPQLQALEKGELDLGILALPIQQTKLDYIPLYRESFWLALPPNHPLQRKKQISLKDLETQEIMLLEDGHCLREQALEVCALAGAREKQQFRGTSLETLKYMVSSGNGMTLVPRLAVQLDTEGLISYLPFKAPEPQREIILCFRKSNPRRKGFQKLAQWIQKEVSHFL